MRGQHNAGAQHATFAKPALAAHDNSRMDEVNESTSACRNASAQCELADRVTDGTNKAVSFRRGERQGIAAYLQRAYISFQGIWVGIQKASQLPIPLRLGHIARPLEYLTSETAGAKYQQPIHRRLFLTQWAV